MKTSNGEYPAILSFSQLNGGKANAYPAHAIQRNQCALALNAILEQSGISRAPGYLGLKSTELFAGYNRGTFRFLADSGEEFVLSVSGNKLYQVNITDGTLTELYTLTGDHEVFGCTANGKFWLSSGADNVKVEYVSAGTLAAYRVGIAAPTGFTASAVAGGSLALGVYSVYASYARKVGGTIVLHSAPQSCGTVTLSGGNQTIRVAATASTDPQVGAICVWLTEANGATVYFFGEFANTTGNKDVTSNANENTSLLLAIESAPNSLPGTFVGIFAHDGRLWGWTGDNKLYFSYKAQNVYDLERFPADYVIPTISYPVLSCFSVGANLYINTSGGIYVLPGAETGAKPEHIEKFLYFPRYQVKTVVEHNGLAWGVTNDGFRYFDGERFSIDLSKHIKPDIDALRAGSNENFYAFGHIHRRGGKRTEYHLSYRDTVSSLTINSAHLILNLDTLQVQDANTYQAAWENWTPAFSSAITLGDGTMLIAQSTSSASTIASESGKALKYCFDETGAFLTSSTAKKLLVRSYTDIQQLRGITRWARLYHFTTSNYEVTFRLLIFDRDNYAARVDSTPSGGTPAVLDAVVFDFVFTAENPTSEPLRLPFDAIGNSAAIEIEQTADDPAFFHYRNELYGETEISNMT